MPLNWSILSYTGPRKVQYTYADSLDRNPSARMDESIQNTISKKVDQAIRLGPRETLNSLYNSMKNDYYSTVFDLGVDLGWGAPVVHDYNDGTSL